MIPSDKLLHLIAGAAIFLIASIWLKPWEAFLIALGAGLGKEAWDIADIGDNDVELMDFIWTAAGGGLAWCWLWIYNLVNLNG